jgi:hypothetical protein
LHHALRTLLIIPQVWIFRLTIQLVEALARAIDVKDASSAVRATA